jgi:predicted outer membrane repeat protein
MKIQNAVSTLTRFMGALLIVMLLLAGTTVLPAAAIAGTNRYVATSGNDSGNCTDSSNPCKTITYAISQASSNDEIYISAGTYAENLSPDKNVYFFGAGRDATLLDGGGLARVVYDSSYDLSFTDLTIQNGHTTNCGGGIEQLGGTLALLRVKVTNNVAEFGGGICSNSSLTITDSVVSDNHANIDASGSGGGLSLDGATASLSGVTISGNTATNYSGGIHSQDGGILNLTNVTISGNTAKAGGAMVNTSTNNAHLLNSTIADNHLSGGGTIGGILNWGTISFKNTIIAGNDGSNCGIGAGSTWTSQGYNLDSGSTCNLTDTGDLQNTDPQLGPLADNGGPTQTHALLRANGVHPISPAIDGGPIADCPGIDQRGAERPFGSACDIGAYEYVERTISGNAGVGNAVLSYHDDTDKTSAADGGGIYSFTVPYGWSGTVTPSKVGLLFTPVNHTYTHVLTDQTGQNFTALVTTSGNAGTSGVTLAYIVSGDPKTVISDAKGNYSLTVPYGWSGTVTASKQCYPGRNSLKRCTFTPVRRSYTNIKVNQSGQNYTLKMVY